MDVVFDVAHGGERVADFRRQPDQKVLFPAEVLPIVTVLANMVHFLLGLPILVIFLIAYGHYPVPRHLLWFPVIVLMQLVLTIGLGLALSALTVHFRDIRDILQNVITLWFFATPIIYYWRQPGIIERKPWLNLNPFTHIAIGYQEIFFFRRASARGRASQPTRSWL